MGSTTGDADEQRAHAPAVTVAHKDDNNTTCDNDDHTVVVTLEAIKDHSNSTSNSKGMISSPSMDSLASYCSSASSNSRKRPPVSDIAATEHSNTKTPPSTPVIQKRASSSVSISLTSLPTVQSSEITDDSEGALSEDTTSKDEPTKQDPTTIDIPTNDIFIQPVPKPTEVGPISPDEYLQMLLKARFGISAQVRPCKGSEIFPPPCTSAAYTTEVVGLVRNGKLDALQALPQKPPPQSANRFGESLLHMACRRGFEDIVAWFLESEEASVRICDDGGRTPLHDACWHPTPLLAICGRLIRRDPALLLVADGRGFTPFQYARPQHWLVWREFLHEHVEHLAPLAKDADLRRIFGEDSGYVVSQQ